MFSRFSRLFGGSRRTVDDDSTKWQDFYGTAIVKILQRFQPELTEMSKSVEFLHFRATLISCNRFTTLKQNIEERKLGEEAVFRHLTKAVVMDSMFQKNRLFLPSRSVETAAILFV